jgi:hypothetical protein
MSYRELSDLELDELTELLHAHRHRWTHTDELLALLLEALHALIGITVKAHADPKKPSPRVEPFRYPRPSEDRPSRTVVRPGEIARRMLGRR